MDDAGQVKRVALIPGAIIALALGGCAHAPAAPDAAVISDGHEVAQMNCASCHAVEMRGDSPLAEAPPFREIGKRYSFPVLEEELVAGVGVGHPPMPKFQLSPRGVDALLAYMRQIQSRERAGR